MAEAAEAATSAARARTRARAGGVTRTDHAVNPNAPNSASSSRAASTALRRPARTLNFGAYGLKALEPERLTAREIEAARRAITRQMKRAGRVWIRIFPDVPVSKKPAEVRMGSGKGAPEFWVAKVKPGRILFEIDGVDLATAKEAMRLGAAKLSIATKFVARAAVRNRAWPRKQRSREEAKKATAAKASSKADDFRAKTADELSDQLVEAEEGAVQPALPARQRPGGEDRPRARRAHGHRAHQDGFDRAAPQRPAKG